MTFEMILVLTLGGFLAYVNGANDVSKGIATLVGSGVAGYRRAVLWGAAWTAAGGFLGAHFAGAILATFGNGLMAPGASPSLSAALAALFGAAAWVVLATRAGLPVSTTHAIVGSLTGVAVLGYGMDAVMWTALSTKLLLPLLVSPFAALLLTGLILRAGRSPAGRASSGAECLCAEAEPVVVAAGRAGSARRAALMPGPPQVRFTTGATEACAAERPAAMRLTLDHLHWLTSGATSLARGMNDAPKIVALILAASALAGGATVPGSLFFAVVTLAMVAGSLAAGRRVTRVLGEKVTPMDHREGFAANLVTAVLVSAGAVSGMPMSTTHVSSGGIIGAGARRRSVDRRVLRRIAFSWVVTLPAAAALGMAAYFAAGAFVR